VIGFAAEPTGGYTLTCDRHEATLLHELASQIVELLQPLASTAGGQPDAGAGLVDQHPFMKLGADGSVTPHSDPALARLLPDAYREEADADSASDFRRFTEQGLVDRKVSNALVVMNTVVIDTVAPAGEGGARAAGEDSVGSFPQRPSTTVSLTEAEAQSWLRSLTDIRLTLAVRIGIEGEDAGEDADAGRDPDSTAQFLRDVYHWLGFVSESLLAAIDREPDGIHH
jgi:hypothetical protein